MNLVSTGIEGLDNVLGGGLPSHRLYLVQGTPGAGKTTLGLQFLLAGQAAGERVLYITLSETRSEILDVAHSHAWDLEGVEIYEHRADDQLAMTTDQTVFTPAEVELTEVMKTLLDEVERTNPQRVVFDSLSEIRLLAGDPLRYRRQILSLKAFFAERDCTVLILDDEADKPVEIQVQTISHGVINLEQRAPEYGPDRRRLRVVKVRGRQFRGGYHDMKIVTGGIAVFPSLIAAEHRREHVPEAMSSGIPELDTLLGGGIDFGTNTAFIGPTGSGKSSLAMHYAQHAVEQGKKVALYLFEENVNTLLSRCDGLGIHSREAMEDGRIRVVSINPAELTPGEFVHSVRKHVEKDGCRLIIIDSLNGFMNAMPQEQFRILTMHEMLSYLSEMGIATILIATQHGYLMEDSTSGMDLSYLADTALQFRHYEFRGEVRQALSVFKRRSGAHERTIRELKFISGKGVQVGPPLKDFHGILTGVPTYEGAPRTPPEDTATRRKAKRQKE